MPNLDVQDYAEATKQLQLAVQMTPWALTENFIAAQREQRGSLALTGPGDPTARGDGFSYMKETAKVNAGGGGGVYLRSRGSSEWLWSCRAHAAVS